MTYIIDPMILYGIDVCHKIRMLAAFPFGISILILLVIMVYKLIWKICPELTLSNKNQTMREKYKLNKIMKQCIIIATIFAIIDIIIPSKETLIQMLIAQNITYERLDTLSINIQELIASISNAVG